MTLKEHYLTNRRKSIKSYFKLIVIFFVIITFSYTFTRYTGTMANNGAITVAKWHIEINGEEISSLTSSLNSNIDLLNVADNTTNIDSRDECYFDIIIDPSTTEVAVSYSISVDLATSNLPIGTKILRYEKFVNTGVNEVSEGVVTVNDEDVSVSESIMLSGAQTALSSDSIRRYRFYCKIPFPIDVTQNDSYVVTPVISVEQYIV